MDETTITALPLASGIDASTDWLAIDRTSLGVTQRINRNTYLGITGSPVGTTDGQELSNKTINNTNVITVKDNFLTLQDGGDVTRQAQFQLSSITPGSTRIYTLPDATSTLADLTSPQTFTNKTLTAPVISGGSIDNSTITVDSIAGHTASTSGTIYGLSITLGKINGTAITNGSITGTQIASSTITGTNLSTTAITLGQAQITSNATTTSTTFVDVPGVTTTVTVPNGGRRVKVTIGGDHWFCSATSIGIIMQVLYDGATIGALTLTSTPGTNGAMNPNFISSHIPSSGSHTYKLQFMTGSGTLALAATSTSPFFILVEAI